MNTDLDTATHSPLHLIAIDLGSNSFHLLVSQWQSGQLLEVDRNKQVVQLARGLDTKGQLCEQAKARALTCLADFKLIIQRFPGAKVRAVGTQALRMAAKTDGFLREACAQLGAEIEVISGEQEAQLSYLGIDFCPADRFPNQKKLVIDIGGASTELIIGQNRDILCLNSMPLGCVVLAEQYFAPSQDEIPPTLTRQQFERAYLHSRKQVNSIAEQYLSCGWQVSVGASGTMAVIADMLGQPQKIDKTSLKQLVEDMLTTGSLDCDLADNLRYDVLPAGLAMLLAMFDELKIEQLQVADATLKEGLMASMIEDL